MSWTTHGHHIPGTAMDEENRPLRIARCGGVGLCIYCNNDAGAKYKQNIKPKPKKENDDA